MRHTEAFVSLSNVDFARGHRLSYASTVGCFFHRASCSTVVTSERAVAARSRLVSHPPSQAQASFRLFSKRRSYLVFFFPPLLLIRFFPPLGRCKKKGLTSTIATMNRFTQQSTHAQQRTMQRTATQRRGCRAFVSGAVAAAAGRTAAASASAAAAAGAAAPASPARAPATPAAFRV